MIELAQLRGRLAAVITATVAARPAEARSSAVEAGAPQPAHQGSGWVAEAPAPRAAPRFDGGSRAVLALAALMVVGSVALTAYRITQPDDGYRLWLDGSPEQERSGGLLLAGGDRAILSVDGSYADEIVAGALSLRPRPPESWRVGGTPTYFIRSPYGDVRGSVLLGPGTSLAAQNPQNLFDLASLAFLPLAVLVFARRPRLVAAQVLLIYAALLLASTISRAATSGWSELRLADLFAPLAFWPTFLLNTGAFGWLLLAHFALVFPRPTPFYLRYRRAALAALYGLPAAWLVGSAAWSVAAGQALQFFQLALWMNVAAIVGSAVALLWSLVHGYRHARDEVERAQVRWGGLGLAILSLWICLMVAGVMLAWAGFTNAALLEAGWQASTYVVLAPPLFLGIAILRYRLFDIDLVLNRALVYGALTVFLAALYGAILAGLSLLFQGVGSWWLTLLAVGAAGALFHPLRERVQRWVNRAMYGDRDEPYAALDRLSDRLGGAIDPDAVLPTIVATIADSLRVPYAAIVGADGAVLAEHRAQGAVAPVGAGELQLPLAHQGEALGQLVVAPRAGEPGFGAADIRLLHGLARQAGAAVHAARLTLDLRRSRERLVVAGEEERRRLQRDIHDGLGPTLAGLTLKLDAARNLLATDGAAADALLRELRDQIQGAVGEIRRLVYALRPPALDQLGLLGAIEDLAEQYGEQVVVALDLPEHVPALPAAAEVAAYRIVQEALTNVVRHSGARRCDVRVGFDGARLVVAISDDGRGIAPGYRGGVGLRSMCARTEELGGSFAVTAGQEGGTEVRATIPI